MPRRRRINLTHRVAGTSAILAIGGLVAASSAMAVVPPALTNSDSTHSTYAANTGLPVLVADAGGALNASTPGPVSKSVINVSGSRNSIRWMDVYTALGPLASDATGTHASWGDMQVSLTHTTPAGVTRTVLLTGTDPQPEQFGGRTNPVALSDTTWSDNGATKIALQPLGNDFTDGPITSAQPEGKLAAFTGMDPNGTWTLSVSDNRFGDRMQLNGWHLDIDAQTVTADHSLLTTKSTYHGAGGAIAPAIAAPPPVPPAPPGKPTAVATTFEQTLPAQAGTITGLQVRTQLSSTDVQDFEFTLVSPAGTIIPLVNSSGIFYPIWLGGSYGGSFTDTIWDDAAATPFSRASFSNANQPALVPEGALSALTGEKTAGKWQLKVNNLSETAAGSTLAWDLIVTTSTGFAAPYTGPITGGGGGGGGGTTVTISSETQCAAIARVSTAKSLKAAASSKSFLAIQQAVATANKRGAAIESWLKAGITTADLCGGAIGQSDLSVASGAGTSLQAIDSAKPRTVAAPTAALGKKSVVVTLAKAKSLQASSVAALKRAKALDARINGNLTGGDLVDGAITTAKLNRGLVVTGTSGASAAKSVTNTGAIKVKALKKNASVVQVLASAASNQKQALTILNRLRATLQTGLTGANFKSGSIGVTKLK